MTTPTQTQGRSEHIFQDLLRKILRGDYAPGTRLPPERELASRYETNRNTLRESIRRLEQAQLVSVRQGSGVTVQDFRRDGSMELLAPFLLHASDAKERVHVLVDLLKTRAHVLEMTVSLAAKRAKPEDIRRLKTLVAKLIEAFDRDEPELLVRGDLALIEALTDTAHSLTLRWLTNSMLELYRGFLESRGDLWVRAENFPNYLHELIASIEAGDHETAINLTRSYYQHVDSRLMHMLGPLMPAETDADSPL